MTSSNVLFSLKGKGRGFYFLCLSNIMLLFIVNLDFFVVFIKSGIKVMMLFIIGVFKIDFFDYSIL